MDDTDLEQQARRNRLKAWVAAEGGHAAVVSKYRLKPSQASFLSQVTNGYSFGPRAARNMEGRLKMPRRYLDQLSSDAPTYAAPTITPDLAAALPVVLSALSGLPPARAASVRAQLDLLMRHPEMRDDVLGELQALLQVPPGERQAAA